MRLVATKVFTAARAVSKMQGVVMQQVFSRTAAAPSTSRVQPSAVRRRAFLCLAQPGARLGMRACMRRVGRVWKPPRD